ncbi:MAG TPA: hypothetical protein PKY64_02470 [Anaerolineaceae bacterium]|nr:hypothetical protein [Anaerolineaceae bacterium]
MRLIKTFYLCFYTDTDHHEQFCGEVQALPKKRTFPFKNSAELMSLLSMSVNTKTGHDEEVVERIDEV